MKKFLKSKKSIALLAVLIVAVAVTVGAFAYFSSTGTGSGTATVGSSSGIELSSDPVGALYPGGADVPVTVDIHNPGGGAEYVGTISGTVEDNGGCLGSWFEVDPIDYNAELAPDASDSADTNVRMLDENLSQDDCQGLTDLTIDWSSN
jgi:hypothetical protein